MELLGKDGGLAARWDNLVGVAELWAKIDAMPARRRQLREAAAATPQTHAAAVGVDVHAARRGRTRTGSARGRRPATRPATSARPRPRAAARRPPRPSGRARTTAGRTRRGRCGCSGTRPSRSAQPIDLVHRVVAADVLAHAQQLARGREQARGVQAARALERRLAQAVGQAGHERALERRPVGDRRRLHGDLLERALAAHAARGGGEERARGRLAQQRAGDLDRVAGQVGGRRRGARRRRSAPRRGGTRARAPRRGRACAS